MRIPLPSSICGRIAMRAVQYAREDVVHRGWGNLSLTAMNPYMGEGLVGIKTSAKHLMFQNQGISPFLMTWVENRTVPLGCKQGDGPHFRRGSGVGKPGYVNIPHRGRVWRDQKWRHPGLKPKHFMQDAITRAINEEQQSIRDEMMRMLKGGNG